MILNEDSNQSAQHSPIVNKVWHAKNMITNV